MTIPPGVVEVLRTAQAELDLLEIWGSVAGRSPQKADRLAEAIDESGIAPPVGRVAMRYKVVLEESDEGYAVSEPEALENIADAIREYLAAVHDRLRRANVREVEVEV
jgi:hypothetical protein